MTLFGNRGFADDQAKIKPLGFARLPSDCVHIKRDTLGTETEVCTGKTPRKREGRDWGDTSTSQGILKSPNKPPEAFSQPS